jgi:PAS domain S-box-containing protein
MPTKSARQSQQPTLRHLEQLMAQLLDGVILVDPTGIILSANSAALQMHGVASVDGLGPTAEGYAERFWLRGADHRRLKHREYPLFRLLAGDSFPDLIVEVAPAGEEDARWIHQVRDVTMDQDGGEPDCLALVICDISARFDAETRFKAMFQANPAPALIVRLRDQQIVQANPGFLALTEFDPDRLIGKTLFGLNLLDRLTDPSARARIEAGEVVAQTEAELLIADGSRRLVIFAGQPIDVTEEDAMLLTFADLEPRREAERNLTASEHYLSAVFEMAPVAMMVTRESDHRIASINAAFRELTGRDEQEATGCTADELQLWSNAEQREAAERELMKHGGFRNLDGRLISNDGTTVDCLVSTETISLHGTPCVLWLYQDITERRRSEVELVDAIDAVLKDASWLSRSIIDKLASLRRPGPHAATLELSPREREILELICNDLNDFAIAEQLGLSRNTIRNHVARIYAKIGVNRRSGAVVWGRERGMGGRQD